jgi:hypothetical protein
MKSSASTAIRLYEKNIASASARFLKKLLKILRDSVIFLYICTVAISGDMSLSLSRKVFFFGGKSTVSREEQP